MNCIEYERYTENLKNNLLNCIGVIGLVAVGSMSRQNYRPDKWSDHDFFVIVQTGHQQEFRNDLSWLPNFDSILLSFQETEHGLKVLYNSGHLIEFAVFDSKELYFSKTNCYQILIDRENIEDHLRKIRQTTAEESNLNCSNEVLIGQFIVNLLVGLGRYKRGEKVSAHEFVKISALKKLLILLGKHLVN
ncbi:hypothetical protein GM661_16315 [Iocasia frigidifontis]|uniref:Uncharacterized protein n=1 Tax=Iocasia fonsfrigidae TaxID=2682810 RepID=A0A8A7KDS3_9FIRM|nr:aminoglycoside 6-adenylyltransferase [Iocasia fonsfrigidae]QTL99410.1 hypothetical protein GM661_16315 [Iocasia fonsfrigidae]